VAAKEVIDSEWRERGAESGDGRLERDLLATARMRRSREALVRHYGAGRFEATYAGHLWSIYQMLGKLQTISYLLRRT
jgi:hypothetical protein